ncbi:MAG: 3-phosphoshikimate 1-carboxyvinyltransferase [Paracoccaceae bacterium]|nr:3-phosphoshikimate 1-carboxyvinyltransferase [Paracoccaceae bacterium]
MKELFESIQSNLSPGLSGEFTVPGDKSISHRALILGSMTIGETIIHGLLESEDVLSTASAIDALGAQVLHKKSGVWSVKGVGVGGFKEPENVIDCGNSGTSVRLLLGAVSTCPIKAIFTGDQSLRKRPMDRVVLPLKQFGATFSTNIGNKLPINVAGNQESIPIRYELLVPSAQVKSAILLAGLNVRGRTTVIERDASRDHTEKMLRAFGVNVIIENKDQLSEISVDGFPKLKPIEINVPGDISSASFPIAAACMVPGSEILIKNVGINPLRDGFLVTLVEMGANIKIMNKRQDAGELVADLRVNYSPNLIGVEVPKQRSAKMIDEYPILSMVAAIANGPTIMKGIRELRYKESDRINAVAKGLIDSGVDVTEGEDLLVVNGESSKNIEGGSQINASNDHRIAMSFACLGLISKKGIKINGASSINTSFPNFIDLMQLIGAIVIIPKRKT